MYGLGAVSVIYERASANPASLGFAETSVPTAAFCVSYKMQTNYEYCLNHIEQIDFSSGGGGSRESRQ
jgi:hypothetical protein